VPHCRCAREGVRAARLLGSVAWVPFAVGVAAGSMTVLRASCVCVYEYERVQWVLAWVSAQSCAFQPGGIRASAAPTVLQGGTSRLI
jgi:hypothetical protein